MVDCLFLQGPVFGAGSVSAGVASLEIVTCCGAIAVVSRPAQAGLSSGCASLCMRDRDVRSTLIPAERASDVGVGCVCEFNLNVIQ